MLNSEFKKLGFKSEQINKIRNTYPINQLTDNTLIEKLEKIFNYFLLLGYKKHEIRSSTMFHNVT